MEHKFERQNLPRNDEHVDQSMVRRPIRSGWSQFRDMAVNQEAVIMVFIGTIVCMAVFPQAYIALIPISLLYYVWATSRKYRLQFKIPMVWGGIDYGSSAPGGGRFKDASAILHLGQDQESKEELWLDDNDARRHGFFIGTTGSGKALLLSTGILTPYGWVMNGDLRPGDQICHPDGGLSEVVSIHPQGEIAVARLSFADGRHADCSLDHLWEVSITSKDGGPLPDGVPAEPRVMTTSDIGIMHGLYGDRLTFRIPRAVPYVGALITDGDRTFSAQDIALAAMSGLEALDYMPSLKGTPKQRMVFLRNWLEAAEKTVEVEEFGIRIKNLRLTDAHIVKQIAWSLGGIGTSYATTTATKDKTSEAEGVIDDSFDAVLMFDDIETVFPSAKGCRFPEDDAGLEITAVDKLDHMERMSCIKIDREDGLFIMEGHIVTHNTELLLGIVSQTLMWSSGFVFIDGKGTSRFYTRVWTLAKRFGREDDVRVLNFKDPGGDPDAPAGGPSSQTNTINPFAKGSSDQLMNIVVSLMGDAGQGNDMWKGRAMSLVTAEMKALCELRDSGEILMDVQAVREFLELGKGFDKGLARGARKLEDVPDEAWDELKTRPGLIELYLRALRGEFSDATRLAMQGFFGTLPNFSLEKAIQGQEQDEKCSSQFGFLSMQLTKPLGSLADDYGHIFRTPLGEVDMDDVVLNRRILIVLLPALEKADEEVQNCGKIIVTLTKMMMAQSDGSKLKGLRRDLVDSSQTESTSPFIVVMDEVGMYMVKGIDVMMAQARGLGFMIIIAGQDMAAMQKTSPQIAETASANASLVAIGKTTDGDKTQTFIQKIFGRVQVAVTSGFQSQPGAFTNRWVDRMDASFQEVDRVTIKELQEMAEGEFYFLFNGKIVRSSTYFIGEDYADRFSVNKFLKVRGPTDKVPNLDQSREITYISSYVAGIASLLRIAEDEKAEPILLDTPFDDCLVNALKLSETILWKAGSKGTRPGVIHRAALAGLVGGTESYIDDDVDWDTDIDNQMLRAGGADAVEADELSPDESRKAPPRPMDPELPMEHLRHNPQKEKERIPAGQPQEIASSLERITQEEPGQRYRGLIDISVAEQEAMLKARENKRIDDLMGSDEELADEANDDKQSILNIFMEHADRASQIVKLLQEEGIDGQQGIDIMRRAGTRQPIPLKKLATASGFQGILKTLEKNSGPEGMSEGG